MSCFGEFGVVTGWIKFTSLFKTLPGFFFHPLPRLKGIKTFSSKPTYYIRMDFFPAVLQNALYYFIEPKMLLLIKTLYKN